MFVEFVYRHEVVMCADVDLEIFMLVYSLGTDKNVVIYFL